MTRIILLLLLVAVSPLCAQMQTLPAGFLTTFGGAASSFPFNNANDHKWQWHYDSSNFTATYPIIINQVYVRALNGATIPAWDFTSVQVSMASSPTDYTVAGNGVQAGHSTTFAANLNPDLTVVRPAAQWAGTGVGGWESLGMTVPFLYDPSLGDDFVVQIEKCGTVTTWGMSIDGKSGTAGLNGGNRYGDTVSCASATSTFANNEYVPLVRIDYTPASGLYSSFSHSGSLAGSPTVFTDTSYSSSPPPGILTWAWDFGDGNNSLMQNPTHTYACQGSYVVTLIVDDGIFPTAVSTQTVTIEPGEFTMTTTGVGDLVATPPTASCMASVIQGYTLVSSSGVAGSIGMGPLFGITPDALTFTGVTSPRAPGNPLNFLVVPGIYPDGVLSLPPGALGSLAGSTLDAVLIYQDAGNGLVYYSNVAQVTL